MVLNLVIQLGSIVEEGVPHHGLHLVGGFLLAGQRLKSVGQLFDGLTCE